MNRATIDIWVGIFVAAGDPMALAGEKLGQEAAGGARSQNKNAHPWDSTTNACGNIRMAPAVSLR